MFVDVLLCDYVYMMDPFFWSELKPYSADEWGKRARCSGPGRSAQKEQGRHIRRQTSHRTGPRKQKIPHIADARTATGRLTEEIKIGPQMIGMIERSATHARTAEAAAGQRRQRYDDG